MELLLTLYVENQYTVTHFKRETFTLYEYAVMFGTSVEAVKRVLIGWQNTIQIHITNFQHHMQFPYLASKFQSQPHRR